MRYQFILVNLSAWCNVFFLWTRQRTAIYLRCVALLCFLLFLLQE